MGKMQDIEAEETLSIEEIKELFRTDADHSRDWREGAYENFDFVEGEGQWDEEDRRYLRENNRPVITFNRVATIINAVAGNEIRNREEVRFFPVEEGDVAPDDFLTEVAKWFRNKGNADSAESDAFYDVLVCGMGWTETKLDYEEDPDGKPAVVHMNPIEMFWDAFAREKNLSDARRIWRARKMPISVAKEMFPDADIYKLNASWADLGPEQADGQKTQPIPGKTYDSDGDGDDLPQHVTLVHLQIKRMRDVWRIFDPETGATQWLEKEEYDLFIERMTELYRRGMIQAIPPAVRQKKPFYEQYWIGADILDHAEMPVDGFTYQCITGYRNHNKGTWHGLLHYMKDPQRWSNKWLSQILHILNTLSKGGVIAAAGAVENMRQFEKSWAKSDQVTEVLDINGIKPKPVQNVPGQLFSMMEFATNAIRDVSGVSLEMLGQRGAIQAVGLEKERKESSQTILSPLFDALRKYRQKHGYIMLQFLQRFMSDGRLVRIVGDSGAQYVPLMLKQDAKYDIFVDEATQSEYMKERVWQMISPMLPQLPPQITAEMLQFSPLPASVAEKLKAMLMQMAAPKPEDEAMKQAEVQKAYADTEMTMSAAAAKRAEANAKNADAQKKSADINLQIAQLAANYVNGNNNGM